MNDGREKLKESDVKVSLSSPFLKWLDNFWYHHKWKVIIIAFFAIVLVVGIVQMIKKKDYDIEITIATHTVFYQEDVDALEGELIRLMPGDFNGDGKKTLRINTYKIYSEDELEWANGAETDSNGNPVIYADESYNKQQRSEFDDYLMTGECTIMILSEYLYNDLVNRRTEDILLKPMSEIFGEDLPEGVTEDGYGIWLYKTDVYKHLKAFQWIPDDAVICIMQPMAFRKGNSEEKYAKAVDFFKNIVEFQFE